HAMNTQIATPMNPEIAGCGLSRRISDHSSIATATPSALQMATVSPQIPLTGTKVRMGIEEKTRPLTPPICSSTDASGSPKADFRAGLPPAAVARPSRSDSAMVLLRRPARLPGEQLIARIEHDHAALADTDPPGGPEVPTGVDPGDRPPPQPADVHRPGAVEQLRRHAQMVVPSAAGHGAHPARQRGEVASRHLGDACAPGGAHAVGEIAVSEAVRRIGQPRRDTSEEPAQGHRHLPRIRQSATIYRSSLPRSLSIALPSRRGGVPAPSASFAGAVSPTCAADDCAPCCAPCWGDCRPAAPPPPGAFPCAPAAICCW